jgi:3-oxocholest-4-en-26-oate---CoA ligase
VRDAVAVGIPDDRFGQTVAAVVEMRAGATADEAELIAHTKTHLAGYKAPRRVRFVDSIGRAPTGKVDYTKHSAETAEWARTVPAS